MDGRTDLAMEAYALWKQDAQDTTQLPGVKAREEDAGGVHITFRDYGHGIPEAELPHVKEKFYKGSSKNRGTGIGLSVCKTIVTAHGGEISAHNVPHGGAQFIFTLPLGGQEDYEYQG